MSALERAEEDMRRGDYAMARQRLAAYLDQKGYDPALLDRLGEISLRMHDPFSAGRYWLTAPREDEQAEAAIAAFRSRAGVQKEQILNQLPPVVRALKPEDMPARVRERLSAIGLLDAFPLIKRTHDGPVHDRAGRFLRGLILFLALLFIGSCTLGLRQIISWF